MFSIGEFSQATGLTVKTLRFYHEEGLLAPAFVDPSSGYRYYNAAQIETARVIAFLRSLELSLDDIKEFLRAGDQADTLALLDRQRDLLAEKIRRLKKAARSLDQFIAKEKEARTMADTSPPVEEKNVDAMLIAAVRMKGKYSDCGKGFAKIGRSFGAHIAGTPFLLHYDTEYKELDADFEACMPVREVKESRGIPEGVTVRELPAARCASLMHHGPYEELSRSYARIRQFVHDKGYTVATPTREIYHKGPGMIFKGNPKNYVTEIQFPIG